MKQQEPGQFAFTTMDGLTLQDDEPLYTYGLASRFSQWELKIVPKQNAPPPVTLHSRALLWTLVSESITYSRELSSMVANFDHQIAEKAKEIEEFTKTNEGSPSPLPLISILDPNLSLLQN